MYTNPETGSAQAFDQIMQAERMTPGAINTAIQRTAGDAAYDEEIQSFYNVDSPAGIQQINRALTLYMQDNGFDVLPRPAPTNQEALSDILDEALETSIYNYPDNIIDVMQRDIDTIMTEGIRFDRNPMDFIRRLNQLSEEAAATGLEGDATYALAMNELAQSLLYSYQQLPDTPGNAEPQGQRNGGIIRLRKGGRPYRKQDYPMDPKYLMPEPPAIMQGLTREEEFDDGAFKFQGSQSDQLGLTPRVFPRHSESDTSPQSHMDRVIEVFKPRMQYYSDGGINKVRPTPNIPATPAKQNPNTTDYVSKKPVDPGFKETLEKIRGRSNQDLPDNYRAGGSISIDEMKYALMKGR